MMVTNKGWPIEVCLRPASERLSLRVMSTYDGLWNLIFHTILNDMQMEDRPALIWKIFFKMKGFSYLLNEVLL